MAKRKRPTFGRSKKERGNDCFDTPLPPLFIHEPLLDGVTSVCEPFAGRGNLVMTMRLYGLTVHASDIEDRGCPDSELLDFFAMKQRPWGCYVLLSNPPYAKATEIIEHAFALGFRLVILLLKANFAGTEERYDRLHRRGYLRHVYVLRERLQDMHDAAYLAAGGKKESQNQEHSWFVFDRNWSGPSTNYYVSIKDPTARMPWQATARCEQCDRPYRPKRPTARFCGDTCRQRAHRAASSVT